MESYTKQERNLLRHIMCVVLTSRAAGIASVLLVAADISRREGPRTAWMCLIFIFALKYIVVAAREQRELRDKVIITLAADAATCWMVWQASVRGIALSVLLIHYVLFYYRTWLALHLELAE